MQKLAGSPNPFAHRVVKLSQRGLTGTAKARIVLAADGLGGALLAQAGESTAAPEPGARIGMGAVVGEVPPFYQRGTIYMTCGAHGYLGLVRLEDGTLDLAAAIDAAWLRAVGGPGAAATRLLAEVGWPAPPGVHDAGWRGTPPLTRRANRLGSVRVFALGDAAGYVEPFTGEGMAWALAAAAAVAPLAASAAERWDSSLERKWTQTYRRVVRSRQLMCRLAAGALRHPRITHATVALLSHVPRLAWPIVYHLNAHVTRPAASHV
jgi:flavin-dependent dehydrogenase